MHHARNSICGKMIKDQTIIEASRKRRGGANAFDNIRCNARSLFRNRIALGEGCFLCGWNLHVHVCHIKPISSYGDDTLVSEINSMSNLVLLCPNCHWMFDNGKVTLS